MSTAVVAAPSVPSAPVLSAKVLAALIECIGRSTSSGLMTDLLKLVASYVALAPIYFVARTFKLDSNGRVIADPSDSLPERLRPVQTTALYELTVEPGSEKLRVLDPDVGRPESATIPVVVSYDGSRLAVFGSYGGLCSLYDLVSMKPGVPTCGAPFNTGSGMCALTYVPDVNAVFVTGDTGGWRSHTNRAFRFDMNSRAWTEIAPVPARVSGHIATTHGTSCDTHSPTQSLPSRL